MKTLDIIKARHVKWKKNGRYRKMRREYMWYIPDELKDKLKIGDIVVVSAVNTEKPVIIVDILTEEADEEKPRKPVLRIYEKPEETPEN